jgi:hypothetical protein
MKKSLKLKVLRKIKWYVAINLVTILILYLFGLLFWSTFLAAALFYIIVPLTIK